MAWLSRIVAGFLVSALCLAVVFTVFDHTVFNSHYLENRAAKINAYTRLSTALSTELSKDANVSSDPQLDASLQKILTPAILQQKINSALDQLQAYYKGSGPVPTIDLTSQVAQAQAAGLPIPQDNPLNKPITISSNTQVKGVSKKFAGVRLMSLLAVVGALLLLLFLSWERHRYAVLPDVAIVCGLMLGLVGAAFWMLPSLVNRFAKIDFSSNAFAGIAHDLASNIAQNLGETFLIIAAVLFGVGLITRIGLAAKLIPKTGSTSKSQPVQRLQKLAARK